MANENPVTEAEAQEAIEVWRGAQEAGDALPSQEQLAAVLSDDPETLEEEFGEHFAEFASADDTESAAAPASPGPEEKAGADAPAEPVKPTTDDDSTPGEEPPGAAPAASDDAAETPDIWANATPEQKAAVAALEQENKSNRGRLSALDRQRRRKPAAAAPAAPAPAPAEPAPEEPDENWEQFKKDYPEIAAPLEKRYEGRLSALAAENAGLKEQITGIGENQAQQVIDQEEAVLLGRHPDWEELTAKDDFVDWLQQQPRYVQEGFARNGTAIVDGDEAASLLDLFTGKNTAEAAPAPNTPAPATPAAKDTSSNGKGSRRQRRLESAVTTQGGQAGPGAGPPNDDFDAAFDHFAKQA